MELPYSFLFSFFLPTLSPCLSKELCLPTWASRQTSLWDVLQGSRAMGQNSLRVVTRWEATATHQPTGQNNGSRGINIVQNNWFYFFHGQLSHRMMCQFWKHFFTLCSLGTSANMKLLTVTQHSHSRYSKVKSWKNEIILPSRSSVAIRAVVEAQSLCFRTSWFPVATPSSFGVGSCSTSSNHKVSLEGNDLEILGKVKWYDMKCLLF